MKTRITELFGIQQWTGIPKAVFIDGCRRGGIGGCGRATKRLGACLGGLAAPRGRKLACGANTPK